MGTVPSLSYAWVTESRVATVVALASMISFTATYMIRGTWWMHPLGWTIAGERIAFVLILGLLTIQSYWTFNFATANDFLESEDILLFVATAWIVASTVILLRVQHQHRETVDRGEST